MEDEICDECGDPVDTCFCTCDECGDTISECSCDEE